MTIQGFREFFRTSGVKFTEWPLLDENGEKQLEVFCIDVPHNAHTVITVGLADFLFTEAGNFIGVLSDESGSFEPKIEEKDGG